MTGTRTRLWYVLGPVIAVLVLLAGWMLVVTPIRSNADDLQAQADAQSQANEALAVKVAALRVEFAQLPADKAALAALRLHIPGTAQLPAYLHQLSDIAKTTGVTVQQVQPGSPQPVGAAAGATNKVTLSGLMQIPVQFAVSGEFANTELFLARLESAQRATLVVGLDVKRGASSGATNKTTNTLTTTITAVIFMDAPSSAAPSASSGSNATPTGSTPS